jgi:hypothetical protein
MRETRAPYKGYVIDARPHQLAADGRWSRDIYIERHDSEGVKVNHYMGAVTFETKDEAIQQCIGFGVQIIDGTYPGCIAP